MAALLATGTSNCRLMRHRVQVPNSTMKLILVVAFLLGEGFCGSPSVQIGMVLLICHCFHPESVCLGRPVLFSLFALICGPVLWACPDAEEEVRWGRGGGGLWTVAPAVFGSVSLASSAARLW